MLAAEALFSSFAIKISGAKNGGVVTVVVAENRLRVCVRAHV